MKNYKKACSALLCCTMIASTVPGVYATIDESQEAVMNSEDENAVDIDNAETETENDAVNDTDINDNENVANDEQLENDEGNTSESETDQDNEAIDDTQSENEVETQSVRETTAETYYVNANPTNIDAGASQGEEGNPFTSLEEAIKAVPEGSEYTIVLESNVSPVTQMDIGKKNVVIKSVDGTAPYTMNFTKAIDGQFVVSSGSITLENVTVNGGSNTLYAFIRTDTTGNATVTVGEGATIQNWKSNGYGVIRVTGKDTTVNLQKGSMVKDCYNSGAGGVIKVENIGTKMILDGVVSNCSSANYGGVIYSPYQNSYAEFGGKISGCKATSHGGVICIQGLTTKTLIKNGASFENCGDSVYGGVLFTDSNKGEVIIEDGVLFTGCTSTYGGAICAWGAYATVTMGAATIENCAAKYEGGAISCRYATNFTMKNGAIIRKCWSGWSGGALELRGLGLTKNTREYFTMENGAVIEDCIAKGSTIGFETMGGGAIFAYLTMVDMSGTIRNCTANRGGAIEVSGPTNNNTGDGTDDKEVDSSLVGLTMRDGALISNCHATGSQANSYLPSYGMEGFGGAIAITHYNTVRLYGGTIEGCTAKNGAGGAVAGHLGNIILGDPNSGTKPVISDCEATYGGAIATSYMFTSYGAEIKNCRATGGNKNQYNGYNDRSGTGGAIYLGYTIGTVIYDVTIQNCSATTYGGGIFVDEAVGASYLYATLLGCDITGCTAGKAGGGMYLPDYLAAYYLKLAGYGYSYYGFYGKVGTDYAYYSNLSFRKTSGIPYQRITYLPEQDTHPIIITDNTVNGKANNLYTTSRNALTIKSALNKGSKIGVTVANDTKGNCNALNTQFAGANITGLDTSVFFSDVNESLVAGYANGTPSAYNKTETEDLVWVSKKNVYKLEYDGNGNTSGTVPATETYTDNGSPIQVTLKENPGNLKKDKAVWVGWSLKKNGTITTEDGMLSAKIIKGFKDLAAKETETRAVKGIVTVYAVWAVDEDGDGQPDFRQDPNYNTSQSNSPQPSGATGGVNASTTSWGDDSTQDTTQLIITAPTRLTFMARGSGKDANLIGKTSQNQNIEGKIINQSCYIKDDLSVVPKEVSVVGITKTENKQEFSLEANDNTNYVEGVKLYVGDNGVLFKDTVNNDTDLGTLLAGTKATTANKKKAVNGSETKIFFSGSSEDDKSVTTGFSDSYETNKNIHSKYSLNLKYAIK